MAAVARVMTMTSRRTFLAGMGSAMAVLAGCNRSPEPQIVRAPVADMEQWAREYVDALSRADDDRLRLMLEGSCANRRGEDSRNLETQTWRLIFQWDAEQRRIQFQGDATMPM